MDQKETQSMNTAYELATYLVDHAMDKTNNNGMLASLALGMAYASLMCSNRVAEGKAKALISDVYERAARFDAMGGSHETH